MMTSNDLLAALGILAVMIVIALLGYSPAFKVATSRRLHMFTDGELAALEQHPETLRYLAAFNLMAAEGAAEWNDQDEYAPLYARAQFWKAEAERHTP